MSKSFKKAIACMLAVLMVAFSAPISAFAEPPAVADYHPDVDIQFSTFYNTNDGLWNDKGTAAADANFEYCGLYDAPIKATTSKNTTTGALEISKLELTEEQTAAMAAYYAKEQIPDCTPINYTYTTGDIFLATVILRNCSNIVNLDAGIAYSDNIEPAGVYSYKNGRKTAYAWGTETDRAAANTGTWVAGAGGTAIVTKQSSDAIYGADANSSEDTTVEPENKLLNIHFLTGTGYNLELAPHSDKNVPFIDPVTGSDEGYTYQNDIIICSFAFQITGEVSAANPIVFAPYDTDNTKDITETFDYGKYGCYETNARSCATYAPYATSPAGGQMTFFGMNINTGEGCGGGGQEETFSFDSFTWDTSAEPYTAVANLVGNKGGTSTAPATVTVATKTAATCGADEVVTYTATYEGNTDTKDVTHTGTATGNHTWVEDGEPNPAPTCTTGGSQAYVCSVCGATKTETVLALGHDMAYTAAVPATCIADGNVAYYYCSRCQKYFADEDGNTELSSIVDPATGVHAWGDWAPNDAATHIRTCANGGETETENHVAAPAVDENVVPAQVGADGSKDVVVYCSVCGYEISRTPEVIPALTENFTFDRYEIAADHQSAKAIFIGDSTGTVDEREATVTSDTTDATCTEAGQTVYTASCDGADAATEANGGIVIVPIAALNHDLGDWTVTTPAVPATCTEAGATAVETRYCSRCDYSETRGGEPVDALGHTMTPYAEVPASCTEDGSEAYWICSVCNKMFSDADGNNEISNPITIPAPGHAWGDWTVTKEATIAKAGEETRKCANCDATETRAIESLDINVTVTAPEGGSVSGDIASGETKQYKFGDAYSITATAAAGYKFDGWKINGKSVSTATTYNGKAFADVTIEPIFAKNATESFTVVFYDLYKTVVSEQTVSSAAELEVPTADTMARQGYTFTGWDKDPAKVTGAAEITAQYDINKELGYTVTIVGADAVATTINGEDVKEKTGVAYDSQVTVYAEGATGWKIGDTVVSTSASYSFYIGSDVAVEAIFDAVELEPAIRIVNVAPVDGSYRYTFVATRVVPDGWKVEKVGFIYGKNLEDDELVLENANKTSAAGTKIKVGYNNVTPVLETSLQYGLSGRSGTIKAKAFMIVSKGATKEIKYSQLMGYDYSIDTIIDGDE